MSIQQQLALLQKPINTSVLYGTDSAICGDDDMQHICDAINHARLVGVAFVIIDTAINLREMQSDGTPKYDRDKDALSKMKRYFSDLIAGMGDDTGEDISSHIELIISGSRSVFKMTILIGPPSETP